MKLNLGCGKKKWEGFTNVDLAGADLNCDIRALPLADGVAEEIHAIHVCEHFYLFEIVGVLKDWYRVLKDGGMLVCELPCWDKVREHIAKGGPENMTRWALYGQPETHVDGEPALHKYCYSEAEFRRVLEVAGFNRMETQVPKFHVPARDMRIVAWK